ncbi:MAG: hypothetical protein ACRETC_02795 [Gammaproteobacteria bacterium]
MDIIVMICHAGGNDEGAGLKAALGLHLPWCVGDIDFDESIRLLKSKIDFRRGSRFAVTGIEGEHPVHDTLTKRYRHLNFLQHGLHPGSACAMRVRLPDGSARHVTALGLG